MRALAEALRFLSVIPLPGRPPKRKSAVLVAYPWAGLVLGLLAAAGTWTAAFIFGSAGRAVTAVLLRIALTGGLHLDGLADLADGLGGGRDVKKRLAIMADSRLGSFGVLALLGMLAFQTVSLGEIFDFSSKTDGMPPELQYLMPLVLAPLISRGFVPLLLRLFPSARPGGMGDRNRRESSTRASVFALLSVFVISTVLSGTAGLILAGTVMLVMLLAALKISTSLGGLTGDAYGAVIEIGDAATFTAYLVILRLGLSTDGILGIFS